MTCRECRNFKNCMLEAENLGQIFDPDYDGEHSCGAQQFSHATNADRIRAMSDEELENFINHFNICDLRTSDECKMSYCACCEVCVMDWLQQPVEGG